MDKIYVTQPNIPNKEGFFKDLKEILESKHLTNGGYYEARLKRNLSEYLGIKNISLVNNGTMALILAIEALGITNSEIITTPYSFVATAQSIIWTNNTPVFVDIDRKTLNISPEEIRKSITPNTKAILGVHCYGAPCNVDEIDKIAKENDLKVIYDAAHCFGVKLNGQSILNYGDVSTLSFHATKIFNTIEGGAVIANSKSITDKIDSIKNFSLNKTGDVNYLGINAKMNEVNAAFGLNQLQSINEYIQKRKDISDNYYKNLDLQNIELIDFKLKEVQNNYSYFPILLKDLLTRDKVEKALRNQGIYARKYFFPLISNMSFFSGYQRNFKVAQNISERILCLPIYPHLSRESVRNICSIINKELRV